MDWISLPDVSENVFWPDDFSVTEELKVEKCHKHSCTQLTNCISGNFWTKWDTLTHKSLQKCTQMCISNLRVVLFTEDEPMIALYNFLENKSVPFRQFKINRLWQTFNNVVQKIQSLEIKGFMVNYI